MRCLLIAGSFLASCSIPVGANAAQAKPFTSLGECRITAPVHWTIDRITGSQLLAHPSRTIVLGPLIYITVTAVRSNMTLEQLKRAENVGQTRANRRYHVLDQHLTLVGGVPSLDTTATFLMGTPARSTQSHRVLVLKRRRGYCFELVAKEHDFPLSDAQFLKMLRSIRWVTGQCSSMDPNVRTSSRQLFPIGLLLSPPAWS